MACCLTAPSHYLNKCWLIISKVEWHSSKGKFARDNSATNHWNYLENDVLKISLKSPRGQWVNRYWNKSKDPRVKMTITLPSTLSPCVFVAPWPCGGWGYLISAACRDSVKLFKAAFWKIGANRPRKSAPTLLKDNPKYIHCPNTESRWPLRPWSRSVWRVCRNWETWKKEDIHDDGMIWKSLGYVTDNMSKYHNAAIWKLEYNSMEAVTWPCRISLIRLMKWPWWSSKLATHAS